MRSKQLWDKATSIWATAQLEKCLRKDPLWRAIWPGLCILSRSLSSKVNSKQPAPTGLAFCTCSRLTRWAGQMQEGFPWAGLSHFPCVHPTLLNAMLELSVQTDLCNFYEESQLSLSFMSNHSFPGLLGICLCVMDTSQVVVHWLTPGWPSKVEVFQCHTIFPHLCATDWVMVIWYRNLF